MTHEVLPGFLLNGDPSIQYLVYRDLLKDESNALVFQEEAQRTGIVSRLLACQTPSGHWGIHYYQPKWTCTHYTLTDLVHFGAQPDTPSIKNILAKMANETLDEFQTLDFSKTKLPSDNAINGMALTYLTYFHAPASLVRGIVRFLVDHQKADGGFSWAHHREEQPSDPHSTICVLEGLRSVYPLASLEEKTRIADALRRGIVYLETNDFFAEEPAHRRLIFPYRYRYSLLRVMEFLAECRFLPGSESLPPALIEWLRKKRGKDGLWSLEGTYPGKVHFLYEPLHQPSRMITLKAMGILAQTEPTE